MVLARLLLALGVTAFPLGAPAVMQAQDVPGHSGGRRAESETATSLPVALLPAWLRAALLSSAPELGARRAALTAAEARRAATGFAPPVVLSLESEESPRGRLDQGSTRLEVSRDLLTGGIGFLFSATLYPISVYPEWIQHVIMAFPLWHGVELVRGFTTGILTPEMWWHVLYFIVMIGIGLVFTTKRLRALFLD